MRRASPTFVVLALAALAILGGLAASGTFDQGAVQGAASPPCLPATLSHDASLGGGVLVSPAPQTVTANPRTQISFLGAPAATIRDVAVIGNRSGRHGGSLRAYSQDDGASFVPKRPFQAGERVQVRATVATGSQARRLAFGFRVETPSSTAHVGPFPNPAPPASDYQTFATLPGVQAPTLTVTTPDRDPAAGDVLTTNGPGPGRYGPLIYTPQGRLVWFKQLPDGLSAENLSVQDYEGQRDLTFWQGKVLSLGYGEGEDVVLDSRYRTVAKVTGGNGLKADLHDFQLAPHGIAYLTAFNAMRCDLSSVEKGSRAGTLLDTAVQEIDVKTGLVRWEWHSLDHVGVSESETSPPKGAYPWDWFHINSIDPQPDGKLLISARSTWACYQLDGSSGEVLWRLGGSKSSFQMGAGTKMAWQHDCRMLPGGVVTVFDDGSNPPVHSRSRGLRVALDYKAHTARLLSAYVHPGGLLSASQGNMQTLPDGNALLGYGGIPAVSEFTPSGRLLFDAHLPFEMDSYRTFRFPWKGRPLTPPTAAANLNNTGEETIVRASWNGATDVATWRVLAGSSPSTLKAQATVQATGFEDATILPRKLAYVAAQALDAAGRVLGASKAVPVSSYSAGLSSGEHAK
jgi:Arylsulfotransferase (ASST)